MATQQTVIFDFDGTLANSIELLVHIFNENAPVYGYATVDHAEFSALRRMGYKKAMKLKGIKLRVLPKMVVNLGREMKQHMGEVQPYAGTVHMLNELQRRNFSIGVLTSNQEDLVRDFFRVHQFPEFDFIVSEKSLFGKDKALKRILKQRGLSRDDVLYVGDEPRDVDACRKASLPVIGVSWGLGGLEGFETHSPDYVAHERLDIVSIASNHFATHGDTGDQS